MDDADKHTNEAAAARNVVVGHKELAQQHPRVRSGGGSGHGGIDEREERHQDAREQHDIVVSLDHLLIVSTPSCTDADAAADANV